ncbi:MULTISPECIES: PBECR4 domain-containing protein [unclassified Granulicatella]|uniref:PBECR4 domain-containing protein n=1 Tax=unclassified Granulicatella TaxID=2630493 RepID=UPI0010746D8B|nr:MULTISPECIES: PBECR4 domain-containing protein [unclassified Granulicatella]MBF0780591.1 toprim domain-containing protein [Granulicatella sp. 19428wC4_WM01]TFU94619.1 hypothetical protein E4T68_05710 [Granulicatella sp. WM01]
MSLTKEQAKAMDIVSVAESLGMGLIRKGKYYSWDEHDSFVINPKKNIFSWFSQDITGDTIALVQTVKGVSFREAMQFLETGDFKHVKIEERALKKGPFKYTLKPYEKSFDKARAYLTYYRGLSDETVNFFLSKGLLALAHRKLKDGFEEDVLVFKVFDNRGDMVGASLQGIKPNEERYAKRGFLKQIMYNSQEHSGFNVSIGKPERLIFFEAPIDLMSYYELHQKELSNVRLVSMDGLKEGTMSRYFMELVAEMNGQSEYVVNLSVISETLEHVCKHSTYFHDAENRHRITLAVDNDTKGLEFIDKLKGKGIIFDTDVPKLKDWNEVLTTQQANMNQHKEAYIRFIQTNQESIEHIKQGTEPSNAPMQTSEEHIQPVPQDTRLEGEHEQEQEVEEKSLDMTKEMTIEDIPLLKQEIAKYEKGESTLTKETIQRYQEELVQLEALQEQLNDTLARENKWTFVPKVTKWFKNTFLEEYTEEQDADKENIINPTPESQEQGSVETKLGDFVEMTQQAAPLLDVKESHPLNDLSPSQTRSQPFLHFTINEEKKSIHKTNYHPITDKELKKLNRYAAQLQQVAKWYLDTLADSRIIYAYQENEALHCVAITFKKEHFMHLTGLFPIKSGQTAERTLLDFANGQGTYDQILIANHDAMFQKLQVLPELENILDTEAFYFSDVSSIPKLHHLALDKAIRSSDKDLLLALRTAEEVTFPASLLKLNQRLNVHLDQLDRHNLILGIYRERGGTIEPLSINDKYIKDGGKELLNILSVQQASDKQSIEPVQKLKSEYVELDKGNEKLDEYWIVEFNETEQDSVVIRSYAGEKVTKELLDELAQLDSQVKQHNETSLNNQLTDTYLGYFKCQFAHLVNGEVTEYQRIDIGDGDAVNRELFEALYQAIGEEDYFLERYYGDKNLDSSEHVYLEVSNNGDHLIDNVSKDEEVHSKPTNHKVEEIEQSVSLDDLLKNKDIQGLKQHLKDNLKHYTNSSQYLKFLEVMSQFYRYSLHNNFMIYSQNPNATLIASYSDWKRKFGRQVKQGEKGLKIYKPYFIPLKDEHGRPLLDEKGQEKQIVKFTLATVFDVSQTEGKALPSPMHLLEGNVVDYQNIYRAIRHILQEEKVSISFEATREGSNGYYIPKRDKIVISNRGMSEAHIIKTLCHESAHVLLHKEKDAKMGTPDYNIGELQAESIAYVVCRHLGIDSSQFTFGYLHMYAEDKINYQDLEYELSVILDTSKDFIKRIDETLAKIRNKTFRPNKFFDQLDEAIQQQQNLVIEKENQPQKKQSPQVLNI